MKKNQNNDMVGYHADKGMFASKAFHSVLFGDQIVDTECKIYTIINALMINDRSHHVTLTVRQQ